MYNIDEEYRQLLMDILIHGVKKEDRTGTGTQSVFGRQIRHSMSEGFPLLTTKKMAWKSIVTELLWFLRGDSDIRFLWENNCAIWDGDWYKQYKTTCSEPYTLEEVKQKVKEGNHYFHNSMFDMGPIYGKQWRSWGGRNILNYDLQNVKWSDKDKVMELIRDGGDYSKYDVKVTYRNNSIDQIQNLINKLKTNPDSRRLMVNAWNVGELEQMVLPPCHYGFQVYTRELSGEEKWEQYTKSGLNIEVNGTPLELKHMGTPFYPKSLPQRAISLMWNQRSVDTFLGLPFNIASYGLLLEIIAKEVNMVPDELIGNLGDVHLYSNHIEQAKEQISRKPFELPILNLGQFIENWTTEEARKVRDKAFDAYIRQMRPTDFEIINYQSHSAIKAPLSN
jgi:thymidylate synthase